jgi:catechol 2,3-dioxygenase-like lactoylglutathione lyase family enzyme
MRLEHVNLVISNISESLTFYQAAFPHWKVRCQGKGEWYGRPRNWIHFGDDYQYLALSDHGTGKNRDLKGHVVGLAHFAFSVENIDALIARMQKAGFFVHKFGDDYSFRRNVYYLDPDGFEIEFVEYSSDLPEERNQ